MSDRTLVDYPLAVPTPGTALEVAPGIHWVRMPLPFALDHINLYLLDDGDGWTIVDCGLDREPVRALWETVIRDVIGDRPVRRVLVTHFHPDHMGLARWLVDRFGAELWMSHGEWLMAQFAHSDTDEKTAAMLDFWHRSGMPPETLDGMRGRGNVYRQGVGQPPVVYRRIVAGEDIEAAGRVWRVIVGQGHSPEHVCLACPEEGLLLAGDQVLPRITTNVSVPYFDPHADPLRLFLESTRLFEHLPEDTLTLCAHDRPFRRLHPRLKQIRDHHDVRLDDAWNACTEPRHAVDLLPVLFGRKLDLHQQFFAVGEAVAHLHRLMYAGRLERIPGGDGIDRYQRIGLGTALGSG